MTPDTVAEWWKVAQDVAIAGVGVFLLIHETVSSHEPRALLVGAGLTLLGYPAGRRIDAARKRRRQTPSAK